MKYEMGVIRSTHGKIRNAYIILIGQPEMKKQNKMPERYVGG
jgi:hypothetical protein